MIRPEVKQFVEDVILGLNDSPKCINSKYFYDAEGDRLFQQIMDSPEYYLTRCEMEIFTQQSAAIAHAIAAEGDSFDVVELGAGDATKSTYLLKQLASRGYDFTYYPIDISQNVIDLLDAEMHIRIPGMKLHGLQGEYLNMIDEANKASTKRKVILFLGSNIGNFNVEYAHTFLNELHAKMNPGDLLLIGIDLKKNPHLIRAAYNDEAGVTRAFNLNLLRRMNRELDADFNVSSFSHYPTYNPINGACRSYLISLEEQEVHIGDVTIKFEKNEPIYLELSQKYSISETQELARKTGFKTITDFTDSNEWFLNTLWMKP